MKTQTYGYWQQKEAIAQKYQRIRNRKKVVSIIKGILVAMFLLALYIIASNGTYPY